MVTKPIHNSPLIGTPLRAQSRALAVVLKIVDGDTIDIRDDVRGRLRIRLLGIDAPETKKPGYTVGCWGPEVTDFATTAMLGQRVAVVTDATSAARPACRPAWAWRTPSSSPGSPTPRPGR